MIHISTKCPVAPHCLILIHEYGDEAKVTSELLSRSTRINAVAIRYIPSGLRKDGALSIKTGTGGRQIQLK